MILTALQEEVLMKKVFKPMVFDRVEYIEKNIVEALFKAKE